MNAGRIRKLLGSMALGAILVAPMVSPPIANADEMSYIQNLNNRGIIVYDVTKALSSGYRTCEMLNYANGVDVVTWTFANSSWSDIPTMSVAANAVFAAVEELCPWHDHRSSAYVA